MSLADEFKLLSSLPFFQDLGSVDLKRLILVSERFQLDTNEYLFRQGEHTNMVFATLKGSFSVLAETSSGEIEINTITGLDIIGEIGAILGEPHGASIRATSPSEVIGIESKLFLDTISNDPATALKTMKILAYRVKKSSINSALHNQAGK